MHKSKKWLKILNRLLFIKDMRIANKYMKISSTSLVIKKLKIKTTERYHFTATRMVIIRTVIRVNEDV